MNAKSCIALVLAGGFGRRFGRDKRAARFSDEQTLIAASVKHIEPIFSQRRVVLRRGDVPANLGLSRETEIIYSDQSERGLGASLAVGVAELQTSDADAVAIFLGDMPWISSHTQKVLVQQADTHTIVIPCYQGKKGHPVVFGREFWNELQQLDGDQGGKAIIQRYQQYCVYVDVNDDGILRDVDHEEDLPRG